MMSCHRPAGFAGLGTIGMISAVDTAPRPNPEMQLTVFFEDRHHRVEVSEEMLRRGAGLFDRMDRDMDRGWRMSREFIEQPNRIQRCQIAADRLVSALATGSGATATLMAGYILARLPGVTAVHVDDEGEMQHTEFDFAPPAPRPTGAE